MANVQVSIDLPYLLLLPPGEYRTPAEGGSVQLTEAPGPGADGTVKSKSVASMVFPAEAMPDFETITRTRLAQGDRLLRRVNHLLRWYRVVTGQGTILEVTRARASPFRFVIEGTAALWGDAEPLDYEPTDLRTPDQGSRADFENAIRKGLSAGTDPDVATLNLLDAEYALSVGRFREAVLLCWGAIDSTFVRRFKALVDERLGEEWTEGRDFLKGIDFGLRHKMTTGFRLLTGRSLYEEGDNFWADLSQSYSLRNKIIHEGQIAHEDEAKLAIKIARKVVQIVAHDRSTSPNAWPEYLPRH